MKMSEAISFSKQSEDRWHSFSYLKKRLKAKKVNPKEKHILACDGWKSFSVSGSPCVDDASKITSSAQGCAILSKEKMYFKSKPMLVEISNIESVFQENRQKTLENNCNSHEKFHDFLQKLYGSKLINDSYHKPCSSKVNSLPKGTNIFSSSKRNNSLGCQVPGFNSKTAIDANLSKGLYQEKFRDLSETFKHDSNHDNCMDLVVQVDSSPVNKTKNLHNVDTVINDKRNSKLRNISEKFVSSFLIKSLKRKSDVLGENSASIITQSAKLCSENAPDCYDSMKNDLSPFKRKKVFPKKTIFKCDLNESKFESLAEAFQSQSSEKNIESILQNKPSVLGVSSCSFKEKKGQTVNTFSGFSGSFNFRNFQSAIRKDLLNNGKLLLFPHEEKRTLQAFQVQSPIRSSESNLNVSKEDEDKPLVFNNKTFIKILQSSSSEKTLVGKGSTWVQSLQWADVSAKETPVESNDLEEKRAKRSIVPGGLAEQMQKFLRKEQSRRVIWNHKMNEIKNKVGSNYLILILTSVLKSNDVIITKCSLPDAADKKIRNVLYTNNLELTVSESTVSELANCYKNVSEMKEVIVLFKKSIFSKLQLKIKSLFVIFPPWQHMYLPSLHSSVILCTYFMELLHRCLETNSDETLGHPQSTDTILHQETLKPEESLIYFDKFDYLDLFGKGIVLSARVQRIWVNGIVCQKIQDSLLVRDHLSFSLLLQTQDGTFVILKINSSLSDPLSEFLSNAEGNCYTFHNIQVSHRYDLKRCPDLLKLFKIFQLVEKSNEDMFPTQRFCYQFIPSSFDKMHDGIPEEKFPLYVPYEIKYLSFLLKNKLETGRFSFIGKILFQDTDGYFVCDESLISSKATKYFKMKFSCYNSEVQTGTSMLVKEAAIYKDCIYVDNFSRVYFFSSNKANTMFMPFQSRLRKIELISFEHILPTLSSTSIVQEYVIVRGQITEVDENSAVSWLECSFCSRENLLQNSDSVIYCEDCSCVVPKPILKVKMDVTVICPYVLEAKINIRLQSSTIKKILKICENELEPECSIADVLQRSTGVLCCSVRHINQDSGCQIFHLQEMKS